MAAKSVDAPESKLKRAVKDALAFVMYGLCRLQKSKDPKVLGMEETVEALASSSLSLVRFGDGEIAMLRGVNLKLQQTDPQLIERMRFILAYDEEGLMVTLPEVFDGLSVYKPASRRFWRDHLLFCRRYYRTYCRTDKPYGSTSFSRPYITRNDRDRAGELFARIRHLFAGRDLIVVEGTGTHDGAGNDLFAEAASVRRILCPPSGAYAAYDRILAACLDLKGTGTRAATGTGTVEGDVAHTHTDANDSGSDRRDPSASAPLFLLSVGPTAKPLALDLYRNGCQVYDIGNLDMEYEWYLMGAEKKCPVPKHDWKTVSENEAHGMQQYLSEVICRIE